MFFFYITNFTKHSSITEDKFLNGNVRPLKPDKALVTNGRQFKSCSNSTFIMHGKDLSTSLVRAWLFKNFTFETNPKDTNQIIWQTHLARA